MNAQRGDLMNLELENKVALIVGASGCIGSSIAKTFAAEGCRLVLSSKNLDKLNQLRSELMAIQPEGSFVTYAADIQNFAKAKKLYEECVRQYQHVDILVNCISGPEIGDQQNAGLSDEAWQQSFQGKLSSYIRMINLVLPEMKLNRCGKIINVVGLSAKEPNSRLLISGVINAGIINFTKAMAGEYGQYNININAVNPGFIESKRFNQFVNANEEKINSIKHAIPLRRIGTPNDIANMIAFLASDRSGYITGSTIAVDGGISVSAF